MSIDHFLDFEQRPDAAVVQRFLLERGLRTIDGRLLLATHLTAFACAEEDRAFGVSFRLNKSDDYEQCTAQMFALVAALLQRFPGDAELSFEREIALLARRGGTVERGESEDVWTPQSWCSALRLFQEHGMELRGSPPAAEPAA